MSSWDGLKPGDRIELVFMPDDPHPLPPGSRGTVVKVSPEPIAQLHVDWDSGSSLMLVPEDQFRVLPNS